VLKLVGTDGVRYFSWPLAVGSYTVGRVAECDFPIPDKTVSRQHATIEVQGESGPCFVTDLGSHNGTMMNGQKVTSRVEVKIGSTIMFGQVECHISSDADSAIAKSRTPTARLADRDLEKSVYMPMSEALQALPSKVTEKPNVLPTFFEMAKMLVLPEPKEIMLQKSLSLISRIIPAERIAVLFTSEGRQDELITAATLLTTGRDPGSFHLSRTIVKEILTDKQAILIGDSKADPRFASQESIIMSEMKSAMAVPLFDEDKVLGILYVDSTNPIHRFTDDYLRLLATFANILAARLLNYELLQERQAKQVFEAELQRASSIQKQLLRSKQPDVPGYSIRAFQEPSRLVGGDLFDVALRADGSLVFVVADVSGKGLGASLLMANILASFRILYDDPQFNLCEVMRKVSLQLHQSSAPEDFATVFIGQLNPADGTLSYVNAGHNPPLVVRKGGHLDKLEACGIMIGAFPFCDWTVGTTSLGAGDCVVVFSDGVTEAEGPSGLFGDERLEDIVSHLREASLTELEDRIMSEIKDFVQDRPKSDDITMLLLKRES
jgi:phosphoserine phosphatase RsbU/P